MRQRWVGIQAANDAVAEHLRATGTRNYPAAFAHVQRTWPELFAGMQVPAGLVAAGNFNPFHDKLGRFTTKDGAPDRRNDGLDGQGGGQTTAPKGKKYDGKITAGAYKQKIGTGHCLPATMREAIAELSRLQTDAVRQHLLDLGAAPSRDGALQMPLRTLEQSIRKDNPQYHYDFDGMGGADIEDGRKTLSACGVDSRPTTIADIQKDLESGLVLVATDDGGKPHAELITSMNPDGSYNVYNPLVQGGEGTLQAKAIIFRDFLRAYALKPH